MEIETGDQPWPHSQRGGMVKVATAARSAGVSVYTFVRSCERGEIPVKVEQLGRFQMVRAEELTAWLRPKAPPGAPITPEQNLFE